MVTVFINNLRITL